MSIVSSSAKKPAGSGCGLLNAVFGTKKHRLPRRSTSSGSLRPSRRGSAITPIKIPTAGKKRPAQPSKSRHIHIHGPLKQNHVHVHVQVQSREQNTTKTVPDKETVVAMGISGELEMLMAERQSYRKGVADHNLIRVSSGNVMVYGNLGNLSQPAAKPVLKIRVANNITVNKKPQQNGGSTSLCRALSCRMDPEELKMKGNADYKNGRFAEALAFYEQAIDLNQTQACYRSNKSAALTALGRLVEAVFECREAITIDPHYSRAHHRLANLYLRLGEAEKAVYHFGKAGGIEGEPDATSSKARAVLRHLKKCDDAKRLKDWNTVLTESGNAITAGAHSAPMIVALQAEAYLKLHRHHDADVTITNGLKLDVDQYTKFFGPARTANLLLIKAQVDVAAGRFDDAMKAVQQADRLDPSNKDLSVVRRRAKAVSGARSRGNDLFKEARFSEACVAYGQGLENEPYNSILLCNRAACHTKLGQFEKAVEDCTAALKVRPSYSKARLRRAECYAKLQKWGAAAKDYEIMLQESLGDEDVGKALFEAQVNDKKQNRQDVSNMIYGDLVAKTASNSP